MIDLTTDTFNEHIFSYDRVLVDFWAEWCGPCKAMHPILEELDSEFPVAKVDADANMELAKEYNVRSIPTMIVFEYGKEVKRVVGARSLEDLKGEIYV